MNQHIPHSTPSHRRLAHMEDVTLGRMIALRRAAIVPEDRLHAAGVPPLMSLEAERQRREQSREATAS